MCGEGSQKIAPALPLQYNILKLNQKAKPLNPHLSEGFLPAENFNQLCGASADEMHWFLRLIFLSRWVMPAFSLQAQISTMPCWLLWVCWIKLKGCRRGVSPWLFCWQMVSPHPVRKSQPQSSPWLFNFHNCIPVVVRHSKPFKNTSYKQAVLGRGLAPRFINLGEILEVSRHGWKIEVKYLEPKGGNLAYTMYSSLWEVSFIVLCSPCLNLEIFSRCLFFSVLFCG